MVKSVQHWTDDIIFKQNVTYAYNEKDQGYQVYQMMNDLDQDFYSYDIKDEILFRISQRIQLATKTDVISRFSSSRYQVIYSTHRMEDLYGKKIAKSEKMAKKYRCIEKLI